MSEGGSQERRGRAAGGGRGRRGDRPVDRGRRGASRLRRPAARRQLEAAADGKLLFFAADGLRQDAVAPLREPRRARPASAGCCAGACAPRAAACSPRRRRTPAPAGSRWPRARGRASPARRTTPSTSTASPSPTARPPSTPACCRPRRSPRRPSAAARRSRRSSGPAAAAAPSPGRRSTSATSARAAAWPRTTSRPADSAVVHRGVRPAVRPSRRLRRPARRSRRRRPAPADGLDRRAGLLQPGAGDAAARARRRDRTSTASTPTSTTAATTGRRPTTACSSRPTKDGDDAVGDLARGRVGRRQGHDPGRRPATARRARCSSRSSGSRPTSRRSGCSTPR